MKKQLLSLVGIGVIATPIATVVACGTDKDTLTITEKATNPKFKGTKITGKKLASVVSDPENPRWQKAKEYVQTNGTNAGFSTETSIIKDAGAQKTWLDTKKEADAWIVGATDNSVAGAFEGRTQQQPVIAYDRLILADKRTAYNWYVTYDNRRVGAFQGLSILGKIYNHDFITEHESDSLDSLSTAVTTYVGSHKLGDAQEIISIGGDPADNNASLFFDGGMNIIKAVANIDSNLSVPAPFDNFQAVAQEKWDYSKGQSFLNSKLSAMSAGERAKIKGILSPNDGMATAAMNAFKNNDMDPKKIYITGQDSNDSAVTSLYLETGQDMTIYKPDTIASAVAVALAKYLVNTPAANVAPGAAVVGADIIAAIKADFGNIPMIYDAEQYSTQKSDGDSKVNTILLAPKVVTHANLSTYFEVKKG